MPKIVNQFLAHVLPAVIRPLRSLWNQIIGFVFFVLAVWATPSIVRDIRILDTPEGSPFRVVVSALFAGLMAYFAISCFLRARRISRL